MKKKNHSETTAEHDLQEAFWKLYKVKSIEKISIREITETAGYHRSTFYLYYKDIYDLLSRAEDSIITAIHESDAPSLMTAQYDPDDLISYVIRIYQSQIERLKILFGPHGDPKFVTRLQAMIRNEIRPTLKIPSDIAPEAANYYTEFIISGIIAVIVKWINEEGKNTFPLDVFIRTMIRMLSPLSNVDFRK